MKMLCVNIKKNVVTKRVVVCVVCRAAKPLLTTLYAYNKEACYIFPGSPDVADFPLAVVNGNSRTVQDKLETLENTPVSQDKLLRNALIDDFDW